MSFPQEILELILDDLDAAGDFSSLKTCSLVCASLCHPTQSRIFKRITLQPWFTSLRKANTMSVLFHRLLTESPHIRSYVRILVIQDREFYSTPGRKRVLPWVLDEATLPLLIPMLTHLEAFDLHARFNWLAVEDNPSLSSAIWKALASRKIESIHFRGVDILSSCISRSPGLKTLLLNDLTFGDGLTSIEDRLANLAVVPRLQLRSVGLCPWSLHWAAGANCPFDWTHLLKLRASPQRRSHQYVALQALLNAASASLLEFEHLPFITSFDVVPPDHVLDLRRLSSLRSLLVSVKLHGDAGDPFAEALWLIRVLDTLPTDTAIQRIVIHLEFLGVSPNSFSWDALDASLMSLRLQAAKVTIFTDSDFDGQLPLLESARRLRIDKAPTFDSFRYADL
ncbi:hypothetical protein B0H11DRAFT_1143304 [Mycena galericulata]|nr:hypothetical protein B0H11DRAFT_1143304 [Mycena galericulata]